MSERNTLLNEITPYFNMTRDSLSLSLYLSLSLSISLSLSLYL